MRFYIARELDHLKRSAVLYAFIPLILVILPVIIGVLGHLSFPGLEGKEADQILPMMLIEHSSDWFAALVMTGALAAFMSTLDSQLLALSTIATRDFHLGLGGKAIDLKKQVQLGRIWVVVFAAVGLVIAYQPFDTLFDMGKLAFAGLAVLFPSTLFILRFSVSPIIAIISILAGEILLLAFYYDLIPASLTFDFESFIPVLAISFIIILLGNMIKTGFQK